MDKCRICAEKVDNNRRVNIFSKEGQRNYLQSKIKKYLYVLVLSNDKLSKILCSTCAKTLEIVHKFATMAYRSQEKLESQYLCGKEKDQQSESIQISEDSDCSSDNYERSEKMEVTIDPMLFLQCGMDQTLEDSEDEDSNSEKKEQESNKNVILHMNGGGDFLCPICGKKISTKGNLKVHLETHRPKGKYGCDICGRIFKTQSNLFRHKEYHGGVQYPCNVCGRVYPTNSTLRAHSITHSDLRPHACPLCDKTFKRNQDLKFHINQHTGARPYQCPYCPKAFASSGNCFSHRKRMHPQEVDRDKQRVAELMR